MRSGCGSMLARVGLLLCSLELSAAFKLTSKAFDDGEAIPSEYLLQPIWIAPLPSCLSLSLSRARASAFRAAPSSV